MVKMPDRISDNKPANIAISYSNSIYSEKVSCDVLAALGFNVQTTILGYLTISNQTKPVIACKNFTPSGAAILSFKDVANNILPDKLGRTPKISEIYAVLGGPSVYFDSDSARLALDAYWDLFIIDAFLGNFDRHGDNWSYFKLKDAQYLIPSPIYDCGSCLYPQLSEAALPFVLANEEQIIMRIDKFPTAALLLDTGMKVNYKDYIGSLCNSDCTEALLRVFPKINLQIVNDVIDSITEISNIRKQFYKEMLRYRYERILIPAYRKAAYAESSNICW